LELKNPQVPVISKPQEHERTDNFIKGYLTSFNFFWGGGWEPGQHIRIKFLRTMVICQNLFFWFLNAMGMKLNNHPKTPERVDAISNTRPTLAPTCNRGLTGLRRVRTSVLWLFEFIWIIFAVIWIYKGPLCGYLDLKRTIFAVIWIYKGLFCHYLNLYRTPILVFLLGFKIRELPVIRAVVRVHNRDPSSGI